ncbi:MAG: SUF system NifU family Fe-S cluster assembly protein [Holophagales bacterium]|nr:SUF system NifU family Fe-S cluster assembly protein [Holophagales bacterium]MYG32162.1 SUF system NifU family Fe-S cluster assembly protein [Holophagales bacterium]MYI80229.1 SUF system NifU family Fe-S cluster assembly protein [Holophagales bacterium]
MSDLRDLYQQVILDHYRAPRNFGSLEPMSACAEGYNPLCGDQVKVYLRTDGEVVDAVTFEGVGCAISTASASLMTEAVRGLERPQAEALIASFLKLMTGDGNGAAGVDLGKLEVLSGVKDYPVRIKCATLAWHALRAALEGGDSETVSTE